MSSQRPTVNDADPDIAAAAWDARLRSPNCGDEERAAYAVWRDQCPENADAFDRLQQLFSALRRESENLELRALREKSLSYTGNSRWKVALSACAAVTVAAIIGIVVSGLPATTEPADTVASIDSVVEAYLPPFYETEIGTQKTIDLEDGSSATLNTNSLVHVRYSGNERRIELLRGQALFEVEKDPERPFIVAAGGREIVAIGTIFDVRLEEDDLSVILVEGEVEVIETVAGGSAAQQNRPSTTRLMAGQKLVAMSASSRSSVAATDAVAETLWRQGRVFFVDRSLREAVAEISRYSEKPLVAVDPNLDKLRVNGMFRTDDPQNFLTAVEAYFPIVATEDDEKIFIEIESR